ncbi:hypothetical protein CQA44_10420 [Helicobacter sp. MIT 14-3879]|nr:hypothetical protein CQA44_10420 [Helicobacter sp. MIT 14-3879]
MRVFGVKYLISKSYLKSLSYLKTLSYLKSFHPKTHLLSKILVLPKIPKLNTDSKHKNKMPKIAIFSEVLRNL